MVLFHKTSLVFVCVLSTTAVAMDFDEQGLKDYKAGIGQMVEAGKTLADVATNKAVALYKAEATRLASIDDSHNIFDDATYTRIKTLVSSTQAYKPYQDDLQDFKSSITDKEYDQTKANQLRGTAARSVMGLLKSRGVAFPDLSQLGNTPKGHAGFLHVNADIAPESAPWLVPGSFSLFYFQYVQRQATRAMVAAQPRPGVASEEKK